MSNSATAFLSDGWHHLTVRYYKKYAYHVTLKVMWLRTLTCDLTPTLYFDGHETFSWYTHWETDISSPSHWRPDITTASTASIPSFLQLGWQIVNDNEIGRSNWSWKNFIYRKVEIQPFLSKWKIISWITNEIKRKSFT